VESLFPGTTSCAWQLCEPQLTRVREIFFRLSLCAEKPVIVNLDQRCRSTNSSAGCGVRRTCKHGRVGITTRTPDRPRYLPLYLLKILYFTRFVLIYYYNAFGAYVILLLFLDLSYLLLLFLLILLKRFWPVYPGICYNFINYPC
jgi:hypothetical protein